MKIIALASASLAFLLFAAGCSTQVDDGNGQEPEPASDSQSLVRRPVGGGGTTTKSCEDKYGDCYIDCSLKGGPYEEGCFDSCDAAYNLCKKYGGLIGGGGGVIMY